MSYPYLLTPRDYQLIAMRKIFKIKRVGLFLDMGCGKTKIALDFIGNLLWHKKISRVLIICPLSVIGVWEEEIERNCPWLRFRVARPDSIDDWSTSVIITNYAYLAPRRKKVIKKGKTGSKIDHSIENQFLLWSPDVVIIDESHHIKKGSTRIARAAHKLGKVCEYALCLTGTPIGNKPLDLWSQFKFLKPDLLNSTWDEFRKEYGIYGGFGGFKLVGYKKLPELAAIVKPYIMTQKKLGLPSKNYIPYRINMDAAAKVLYKKMEDEFIIEFGNKEIIAPIALAKLTKLSQMTGGFIRDNEGIDHLLHTSKLDALKEICNDLQEQGVERVVIFARFLWELDSIRTMFLESWPINVLRGDVKPEDRKYRVKQFNESGGLLLCQTSVGSEGQNLQTSNYAIFYSVDYSYINFVQAQDRIHRMGQTKPCFYYLLRCKGTVDTAIYRALMEKKDIAESLYELVKDIKNERD